MTAMELISELRKVSPEAEVTITAGSGETGISRVANTGYCGRVCIIAD